MQSLLKEKVSEVYGSPVSAARDCEELAKNISIRTGRSISSTTLRRFFGLLNSRSSVSRFNLDTLAIYCGAPDYNTFCKVLEGALNHDEFIGIQLSEKIDQATTYTLSSIGRKTLGGFERTIPRIEVNRKLDDFIESDYSIFPLIAPGGYGKSTALAHWVKGIKNDRFCLFTGAGMFLSMLEEKQNNMESIALGLEDPGNIFNRFNYRGTSPGPSLVVVIDALDEISNDPKNLLRLIDYLFDAASLYSEKGRVKFVFSIREASWSTYVHERFDRLEASSWFEQISPMIDTGYTNLPPLSNPEIRSIVSSYNREREKPLLFECISWDIREQLRIPIQLHIFCRLYQKKPFIEHLTRADFNREYLREYLFESKYAEEKEDVIWLVLKLMDDAGNYLPVGKTMIKKRYPILLKRETGYYQAYQELISDGILFETREENPYGIYESRVGFRHINFFVYLYALYLIREVGELNFSLISGIAKLKKDEPWISEIIATLYQVAYESENLLALKDFCELPEIILSSLPVRLTVGSSFRKENKIRKELTYIFAASPLGRKYLFEYYVDTNYIFNNYRERIREYLKHKKGIEAKLFSNAILYLAAFFKMEKDLCTQYASVIETIEPKSSVHPWPIGRKVFTHIIQEYFVAEESEVDSWEFIEKYRRIAYRYTDYLENGLIEFELYVMIALVIKQDFENLHQLLNEVALRYNLSNNRQEGVAILRHNQNAIPMFFLEYANYKLGYDYGMRPDLLWEKAIDNFTTNYDDYQYLILLNWFLVDFHWHNNNIDSAMKYYQSAIELSRFAGYTFYEALLLVNHPMADKDLVKKGMKMIGASGLKQSAFKLHIGSSGLNN